MRKWFFGLLRSGRSGTLDIVDMVIAPVRDHVFNQDAFWQAFNLNTRQMVVGLDTAGVPTRTGGYSRFSTRRCRPSR